MAERFGNRHEDVAPEDGESLQRLAHVARVSPRPGMRVEGRATLAIPTALEPGRENATNCRNPSLGETRLRGPVSPRPGMGVEGRAIPAIPMIVKPGWGIETNGRTRRNETAGIRVSERLGYVARSLRDRE